MLLDCGFFLFPAMVLRYAILVIASVLVGFNAHAAGQKAKASKVTMRVNAEAMSYAVDLNVQLVLSGKKLRRTKLKIERRTGDGHFYQFASMNNPVKNLTLIDSVSSANVYTYRVTFSGIDRKSRKQMKAKGAAAVYYEPPEASPTPTPPGNSETAPEAIELGSGETRCPAEFKTEVLDLVNAARSANGLAPLSAHDQLDWSAEFHNDWMIRNNLFEHTGWYESILESGFNGTSFGQNIARYIPTPAGVVEGWMNSPGHRANILKSSFGHMGISCLRGPSGETWWTQDFGS
ncbi:MAG: CAP domain-containing protein [Deltaproteobacteria bacterium]|nr:CAP domain-containing protein [Deltaproteobacteria bacterium]